MNFLVLNRDQIEKYDKVIFYQNLIKLPHIVISICDPEGTFVKLPKVSTRLGSLFLQFSDLDFQPIKFPGKAIIFNEEHAKRIFNFFNDYKNSVGLIICQCEAGISRSAGIAGALAKSIGQNDNYFFRFYIPNKLVYRLILKEAFKEK